MKHPSISVIAALAIATILSVSYMLDIDHGQEWQQSSDLQAAQAAAMQAERKQKAAQEICNQERGPQSEAQWTQDGELICTARCGNKSLKVQL
jgi:hypothetical protein